MTGNLLIDNAISFAGIAFIVILIAYLFKSQPSPLSPETARARVAFDEPDFIARDWIFDPDNGSALAVDDAGEFVLLKVMGIDLLTRRFPAGGVSVRDLGHALSLDLGDHSIGRVEVSMGDAGPRWHALLVGGNSEEEPR